MEKREVQLFGQLFRSGFPEWVSCYQVFHYQVFYKGSFYSKPALVMGLSLESFRFWFWRRDGTRSSTTVDEFCFEAEYRDRDENRNFLVLFGNSTNCNLHHGIVEAAIRFQDVHSSIIVHPDTANIIANTVNAVSELQGYDGVG